MLTNLKRLSIGIAAIGLLACNGGGGGGGGTVGGGTIGYTHAELAQDFEDAMWYDLGYDVELVKTYTAQTGYVVVYDYDLGTYDAYDIYDYIAGEDISNYLDLYEYNFYYDLIPTGTGYYRDPVTGTLFEKTEVTPKDRLKIAAFEEGLMINKAAERLSANFGLSAERSQEVAKLSYLWKKQPKERMTDADHDRFASAILGHSLTEFKSATDKMLKGDKSELDRLISDAADLNGLTPEDANQVVDKIFAGQLK